MDKIFVCDDDRRFTEHFSVIIKQCCPNLTIRSFSEPRKLLIALKSDAFDLPTAIFLDIEIGNVSGIDVAAKVSEINSNARIVFMTGYADKYSQSIFFFSKNHSPYGFITKPVQQNILAQTLERLSNAETPGTLVINSKDYTKKIRYSDIVCIESLKQKLKVHTCYGNVFEFYGNIKDIEQKLSSDFFDIHRTYRVNLDYIESVDKNSDVVTMIGGKKLNLSRNKKKSLIEAIANHSAR